ncbi:MAG: hypothetical protein HY960_02910 [Ignavibacteriae bacterium]|nr:hypothetical protein [Ignavibacteriota bacterium]
MSTADFISAVSAGAAIISLIFSSIALIMAGKSYNTNKKMFKRQGVIDLFMAWSGVNEIQISNLITPDVVKAVNALALTATLWNHDIIEKEILYQTYWIPYKDIYDTLQSSSKLVPGINRKCRDLLTSEIIRAYQDMQNMDINKVTQSTI